MCSADAGECPNDLPPQNHSQSSPSDYVTADVAAPLDGSPPTVWAPSDGGGGRGDAQHEQQLLKQALDANLSVLVVLDPNFIL